MIQHPLSVLEAYFRSLIRDEVRSALPTHLLPFPNPPDDRIGGIALAVEVTGMAKQTIYNMVSQRTLPHSKRGGRIIFEEKVLRTWMVENRRLTKEEADIDNLQPATQLRKQKGGQGNAL